ncbi:MAG: tRNA pseudouridine(38-40) synthase TruA [Filifactoraceae bacterium]
MKNYKFTLAYDGSRYKGYQKQTGKDNILTIQGKIEDILEKLAGKEIQLIGCGRTDTGVHAIEYIGNAHLNTDLSEGDLKDYINEYLPDDILIKKVEIVDDRFHSRYNIKTKTYLYVIRNSDIPDIFQRRYEYQLSGQLNIDAMKKASQNLIGTHDFASFTNIKPSKKSTERTVESIDIQKEGELVKIYITADGFLWNMARLIVGTLLDIGEGYKDVDFAKKALESKDRSVLSRMANPKALFMYSTKY